MPQSRGGQWEYAEGEPKREEIPEDSRAEGKRGHRGINSFTLPTWVQHPDVQGSRKFVIEKHQYVGIAVDGSRNYENWNVAHVAAFHDDLKLLSLATPEQLVEPNRWGLKPVHMCSMGVHEYGPALCVLYELVQKGAADPTVLDFQGMTPWHLCQRMHSADNLKEYEKVLYKGHKPNMYDKKKEEQLRRRGKFADKSSPFPVCLLFPGQGSQYVGMLHAVKDLPAVKTMLETANRVLGYDMLELCLNGPEEKLARTQFCQPALYIGGLAAIEQLKVDQPEKVARCQAVAGLSLGEYTALTVAGVFDFETGLRLVKTRAEAMEHETSKPDAPQQAMLSVAGLDQPTLANLCKECAVGSQVCQIANHLFPKGFAVAGNKEAVESLQPKVLEAGALQAKLLKTSGAFHTTLMGGARSKLLSTLKSLQDKMQPPRCHVYMNITSKPIGPSTSVNEIVDMLGDQLVSAVLWDASMQRAIGDGCKEFFECGPNKQLKAMMKRINMQSHNATVSVQV